MRRKAAANVFSSPFRLIQHSAIVFNLKSILKFRCTPPSVCSQWSTRNDCERRPNRGQLFSTSPFHIMQQKIYFNMDTNSMNSHLEISGIQMITSIADSFKINSNIAGHIKSITIDDKTDETDEGDENDVADEGDENDVADEDGESDDAGEEDENNDADEDEEPTKGMTRCCDSLGFVLEEICLHGQLESFNWPGFDSCYSDGMRSEVFWKALSKAAATLRHLNIGFYVHELHKLRKLVSS
jgi:hypothetical protein